jgi:hypothetical protein
MFKIPVIIMSYSGSLGSLKRDCNYYGDNVLRDGVGETGPIKEADPFGTAPKKTPPEGGVDCQQAFYSLVTVPSSLFAVV